MLYHYSIMGTAKATNLCKTIEKCSKSAKKMKKCAKKKKPPPRCSDSGWFVGRGLDRLTAHNERRQFAAQTHSCGCLPRRGKHCSLPSFAALNCGPTRTTPHRVETAAVFFGSFFCWQKKEQPPGRLPLIARFTQILHNIYLPVVVYLRRIHYNRRRYSVKLNKRMDV
mgnify:CR=1 FL=1